MLLGCFLVLLAAAGASAVFAIEQVHTFVQDLSFNKPLKVDRGVLAPTYYGGPETLLLVGDDTRSVYKYYNSYVPNLANEMLLVRIDPSKPWISMMSIPRELWVPITPPSGQTYTNRLNSAYTYGATTLLRTIKQVTGLSISHVIATTFTQFERAINTLGCVYDTIDERYYNLNNGTPGSDYQSINLQPGYQCLNGTEAEQFVSYRHTDTSQIRDSRDQSFLLAVKKQYGPELAGNIGSFEQIFGKTVQTDSGLRSSSEILNLADLLVSAAGLRVRQVTFQASPLPSGDLTASPQQIQQSTNNFLNGASAPPTKQIAALSHRAKRKSALAGLPLTRTLASNVVAEKAAATRIPFTAEFPKVQDASGASAFPVTEHCTQQTQTCLREYLIHAPGGAAYPIYVEVFSNGQLGQFYDVQGTTWTGAPLFANPDQTVQIGNRVYDLFYDGSQVQAVSWHEHGAVYWVHNTLTNGLSNGEMLAIAEQTSPVTVSPAAAKQARVSLKAAIVPTRIVKTSTDLRKTIGSLAGLVTLLALPLLAFFAIRRMLETRKVRRQIAAGEMVTGRLPLGPGRVYSAAVVSPAGPPVSLLRGSASGSSIPGMTIYRRPRRRRLSTILLAVVVVAAGGALGYVLAKEGGHVVGAVRKSERADRRGRAGARGTKVPDVPVAVLNATQTTGAAHQLAVQLQADGVTVNQVGNVTEGQQGGLEILYGVGEKSQAQRLARLLSSHSPTVGPIDSGTAAAAGTDSLAVVIT